ncbi:tape measure protein [Sphingomonas profundi]|uniref:tape measure protein n=1 Tax=Alterirhizorhabdus profundi TaxID=2681549 RepID=UPI0012E6F041|nr:tape measure protein [Sphingomonas profundi]
MPSFDIIARLKLAGERFSSDYNSTFGGLEQRAKQAGDRVGATFSALGRTVTGALAGIGVAGLAREYLQLADESKKLDSQLRLATATFGSLGTAQSDVARIAGETRNSLAATTDLYAAFLRSSEGLGKSQTDAARATETFSKALKIGGADANAAASATLQFGQALASGVLRGDEFNSIAEASPRILRLLADSLGVSSGALRQMAADGKLSADVLYKALTDRKFTAGIDAEFGQLPVTFGEATQKIHDAAVVTFGAFDRGGEFSKIISNFVVDASGDFASLEERAAQFGVETRSVLAGLTDAFDPLYRAGDAVFTLLEGRAHSAGINIERDIQKSFADIDRLTALLASRFNNSPLTRPLTLLTGKASGTSLLADYNKGAQATRDQLQADARDRDINARFKLNSAGIGAGLFGGGAAKPKLAPEVDTTKVRAGAKEAVSEIDKISAAVNGVKVKWTDVELGADKATEAAQRFYKSLGDAPGISDVIKRQDEESDRRFNDEQDRREQAARAQAEIDAQTYRRQEDNVRDLADFYASAFEGGSGSIWKSFKRQGLAVISEIAARYTLALLSGKSTNLGGIISSASGTGSPLGSLLGSIGSIGGLLKGGSTAAGGGINNVSQVLGFAETAGGGGAVAAGGGLLGGASGLAGSLSAAAPYLAVAAVALPVISKLLKKTKKGSSTIGFTGDELGITSTTGNSAKFKAASIDAAGSVIEGLQNIADQLGGSLAGNPSVSIGVRHGDYRVDTSGRGITKKAKGAIDFDGDQEAAVKYAIADALKDGVLTGVSAATKRLLESGGDLDAQLQKAVTLESIPKLLKARLDPVGAAVDAVTEKFAGMVKILDESGASAEQRADAEKLYRLELEDARKSAGDAAESLKAFLDGMKTGSDSPYSLRDQETAARAALDPYLADINAGVSIDQQKYLAAAQSFLDVERELYGSTQAYFDALNTVQAATGKAIATIGNATPITGAAAADPFAKATAAAAEKTATATSTATDLLDQMSGQLGDLPAIRAALEAIVARGGTALSGLGAARGYV